MSQSIHNITGINVRYVLIRDKRISTNQAFLLSLLLDLNIQDGLPSNKLLAKSLGTTVSAISNMINKLKKGGFILGSESMSDHDAFIYLNKRNSVTGCLFCGVNYISLDEHHYPIRAKDGGTHTISLCPNCHRHFHELVDYKRNIVLSREVQDAR